MRADVVPRLTASEVALVHRFWSECGKDGEAYNALIPIIQSIQWKKEPIERVPVRLGLTALLKLMIDEISFRTEVPRIEIILTAMDCYLNKTPIQRGEAISLYEDGFI